jgi:RND family efflux transporter MFP subunit
MTPSRPADRLAELKIGEEQRGSRPFALVTAIIGGILVIGGGVSAVFLLGSEPEALAVRTARVRSVSVDAGTTVLNASGYVTARRQATVSSKTAGQIIEIAIEEGMEVTAGQVLARLDASNLELSLGLAEAQTAVARKAVLEAEAQLAEARLRQGRTRRLVEEQVAGQADLDQVNGEVATLEARIERQQEDIRVSERQADVIGQQIEDMVIRAPFDGVITAKNAQPGEMMSPIAGGAGFTRTGIGTIVDMTSLEIEVDVNEAYINRVSPGQPVDAVLDSYDDWTIPARVIAIIPTADRDRATVRVRIGFEELDPRILPDMGVKVSFRSAEAEPEEAPEGLLVDAAAVFQDTGRDLVYLVRDGRVQRRAVRLGDQRGSEVFVLSGLVEGDRVVVEGPEGIEDGAEVIEAAAAP